MTSEGARIAAAIDVLQEGLADEALEATGVMERALAALGVPLGECICPTKWIANGGGCMCAAGDFGEAVS